MKKINLPKWAVVTGMGNARMIHLGNGEFVSADAHAPKVLESAIPNLSVNEADRVTSVQSSDAPYYQTMSWEFGEITVLPPPDAPAE